MSVLSRAMLVALAVASAGYSCAPSETVTLERSGKVCVSSESSGLTSVHFYWDSQFPPEQLVADRPLTFTVAFEACLSSSCDTNRTAECEVAVDGDTIVVSSAGSFDRMRGSCTKDCGSLTATCSSPPLPEGQYTVVYGLGEMVIELPSTLADPCVYAE
jgi:hypothetical protein